MKLAKLPINRIKREGAPVAPARQESLRQYGQLLPISVVPSNGDFETLDGRRRLAETEANGDEEIEAIIFDEADEETNLLRSLALNMTRSSSPMIEAKKLKRLIDEFGWTQRRLAKTLVVSQGKISQYLKLIEFLIPHWQQELHFERISFTVARALCRMSAEAQEALTGQDVTEDLVNEQLRTFQVQAINLGDLGVPAHEPTYAADVFIPETQMQALAAGETIDVLWQGQRMRLVRAP
ncbi:MAG: ParB N-terminal domain-containing protein [Anaerolineae bacterium]|nr:ParB N-terminal domain-containing protein [Anaerolineae bacterium]